MNKYKISIKSIPFYITYFWKQGLIKTLFNIREKTIFDKFRVPYNILGEKYDEFYGVGSDEVFSFETGVTDTFWGINTKAKKLVSYAASFGPSTIQEIKDKKLDIKLYAPLPKRIVRFIISVIPENVKILIKKILH